MVVIRSPGQPASDMASAIHDAAEPLAALWTRSATGVAHQVSASQLRALLCIRDSGRTNLTHLAESLGAMLSSASRLCERLVAAGLVERRASRVNRRELDLALTLEGERLLAGLQRQRVDDIASTLDAMAPAARAALLAGLEAYSAAAGARDQNPASHSESG